MLTTYNMHLCCKTSTLDSFENGKLLSSKEMKKQKIATYGNKNFQYFMKLKLELIRCHQIYPCQFSMSPNSHHPLSQTLRLVGSTM